MRYLLDDTEIDSPLGVDGLTLKKARHPRYWGFLYRKLGYADGVGSIRLQQPEAVSLIKQTFARYGVEAATRFRIVADTATPYDAFINYATYESDSKTIAVSFRDNEAVTAFDNQATTTFSISPSERIGLHARRIGGAVQLLTDPTTLVIRRSTPNPTSLNHSIPLTRKSEKDDTVAGQLVPVVTPLAGDPMYRNTTSTNQTIQLSGILVADVVASSVATVKLVARALDAQDGIQGYLPSVEIGTYVVNLAAGQIRAVVGISILIPTGCSLRFGWESNNQANSWSFTYSDETLLSVTDESKLSGTTGYGILAVDLLDQLVYRASNGKLTLRSDLFSTGGGKGLMLANGAGVRGIRQDITTTLQVVFEALNGIWNLAMWVDGMTVRIESKADAPKRKTIVRDVLSLKQTVAAQYVYNQVQIGYQNWQGSSVLSGLELNGSRQYTTRLTTVRNELDLRSSLIASSSLIEEQRRKQLDPKTASSGKADSLDNNLFAICSIKTVTGWVAETTQFSTNGESVFEPETLYNRRITPRRNLDRWLPRLGGSLPLSLESVAGSAAFKSDYNELAMDENQAVVGEQSATPMLVIVETPMDMLGYERLGEEIEIDTPLFKSTGELLDAQWRKTTQGEIVTLSLLTWK